MMVGLTRPIPLTIYCLEFIFKCTFPSIITWNISLRNCIRRYNVRKNTV